MPARLFAENGAVPPGSRERRRAAVTAFATRRDGSVVEMTVTDFSKEGFGVLCTAGLMPGEPLNVAVRRRGAAGAVVRWSADGKAGLAFTSQFHPAPADPEPRVYERVSVGGEVSMRRAGKIPFRVRIYDISPDGCKAEFVDRPELHEQLWIKLERMEALEARVRWIVGAKAGLKFVRPIHAAVFDMLIAGLRG